MGRGASKLVDMEDNLLLFIDAAKAFGVNYVFIGKGSIDDTIIERLRKNGYSILVGQGEVARIKISW